MISQLTYCRQSAIINVYNIKLIRYHNEVLKNHDWYWNVYNIKLIRYHNVKLEVTLTSKNVYNT